MDADILTTLLNAFRDVATLGMTRLTPHALALFAALATVQLLLLGLWMLCGGIADVGPTLVTISLKLSMYLWLLHGWQRLTRALVKGFIAYGLFGGSNGEITEADFTDPSRLAWFGITAMVRVFNRIFAYSGIQVMYNLHDILFTGIAALFVLVAFIWIAIEVFRALLEFYVMSAAVSILVPFGILPYTTFLAEKAIALVWAYALKLLILSFITGIALPLMKSPLLEPGLNPGFWPTVTYAIAGWALLDLIRKGPQLAMGLLQGSPQLTAQDVTRAMTSAAHKAMAIGAGIYGGVAAGAASATAAQQHANAATGRRRP